MSIVYREESYAITSACFEVFACFVFFVVNPL